MKNKNEEKFVCAPTCCKNKICCEKQTCVKPCCSNIITEKLINNGKDLPYPVILDAPAIGEVINLEELRDGFFSERETGDGFAIRLKANKEAQLFSPVDGIIEQTWPTHHAYIVTTPENIKILVHVGTDATKMTGEGFSTNVKRGDKVKAGQVLGIIDVQNLTERDINSDVICIILNTSEHKHIVETVTGNVLSKRKDLFMVVR